ncbi:MAG: plasmid pRiA4b ORF-3 family protein [Planctomycetes bacterium]|nr:plasmid pRiA4b ORF-3 family protein [Planctomycetota bacterium]
MPTYFDLEISLLEIEPRIWRRLLIHSEATFMNLHYAIQQAFGWQDCHLCEFLDGKRGYVRPLYAMKLHRIARSEHAEPHDDEPDAPVADDIELRHYLSAKNNRCFYVYDFGDNWQHLVEVKETLELPEKFTRRLLNGARACPPEDCGGTMGYEECCEAVSLSKSDIRKLYAYAREEVESRLEWLDGWQPEVFALEEMKRTFDL